jgi:hypothetical protein
MNGSELLQLGAVAVSICLFVWLLPWLQKMQWRSRPIQFSAGTFDLKAQA